MPHPVDISVGRRVRLRRVMAGMTQEALGERLGVTFQQVQKYEKGTNRISASRLSEIAELFGVHPGDFFGDKNAANDDAPTLNMKRLNEDDLKFLMVYEELPSNIRKRIRALAYAIEAWVGTEK